MYQIITIDDCRLHYDSQLISYASPQESAIMDAVAYLTPVDKNEILLL